MKKLLTSIVALSIAGTSFGQAFFDQVNYRGAFAQGSNWTSGWANFNPKATLYPGDAGGPVKTLVTIADETHITSNTTWTSNNYYVLAGQVYVDSLATLTIQQGTVVRGNTIVGIPSFLCVRRGAKIQAVGTASDPIVFTSNNPPITVNASRVTGSWGGLLICGKAPINVSKGATPGKRNFEALQTVNETNYGGGLNPDATDNSGVLKYIRVEFAGDAQNINEEINGVMFAGVGSGTVVDFVQASYANDDSFEWYGGSVNAKHLIAFAGTDDDFDIDEGFSGKVQYGLGLRHPNYFDGTTGNNSNFFEMDNNTTSGAVSTSSEIGRAHV